MSCGAQPKIKRKCGDRRLEDGPPRTEAGTGMMKLQAKKPKDSRHPSEAERGKGCSSLESSEAAFSCRQPDSGLAGSGNVRQCISLSSRHLLGSVLLWEPCKTNTDLGPGKRGYDFKKEERSRLDKVRVMRGSEGKVYTGETPLPGKSPPTLLQVGSPERPSQSREVSP